jgi:PAS domain S-box-containing protein
MPDDSKHVKHPIERRQNVADRRDTDADQRDTDADRRDTDADQRDTDADQRDTDADQRDTDAEQRDTHAAQRDTYAQQRDSVAEQRDAYAEQRDTYAQQRDSVAEQRDTDAEQRDGYAAQRDTHAAQRDTHAEQRDTHAEERDTDAEQRDNDAEQRDWEAAQRDNDAEHRRADTEDRQPFAATWGGDDSPPVDPRPGLNRIAAAAKRNRGWQGRRADAAERWRAKLNRGAASDGRNAGANERSRAELSRGAASDGRIVGANERSRAEISRDTASQGRAAGAIERTTAERDRSVALDDRDGLHRNGHYASEFAGSLGLAWCLRDLDPPAFLYVSPRIVEILGLDPEDASLTLDSALTMVHEEDRPKITEDYLNGAVAGHAVEAEMRIVRPDGEVRWLRATSYPVTDDRGVVVRSADTVEDITARKSVEAVAHAGRVEADRANAAKSEFLSRMSHELRTPLNAVMGFARILELDPLSESQEDAVGYILRGGKHLLEIINEVLDVARLENDQVDVVVEPVLIRDLLADAIGLMRPLAEGREIDLRCDLTHRYVARYVIADPRRLLQVLINLLSNAIKYNSPGGQIDVSCAVQDDELQIIVADDGNGIREADLPRLFIPYDRLGEEDSDIEGTGIGLSVAKHLITKMDGRIDVHSEFGFGTTFTVAVPLSDGPAPSLT